jgi:molybdate/tungstate transport system substrate-binding protein
VTFIKTKRLVVAAGLAFALTGCGTASPAPSASSQTTVHVVYAGSLAYINDVVLGPAFTKVTGTRYEGQGGGSFAMAKELASHLIPGDVFESVGTAPIEDLQPHQTTWSVRVSATPLVIAYNPKSPEAGYFRQVAQGKVSLRNFFEYLATHPINIGRTNPLTDPQGQAFYEMVELAVRHYELPADTVQKILGPWNNSKQIYSEEGLPTELQSGGLDLSSAFLPEVIQDHMDYIRLPGWLNFSVASDAQWYAKSSINLPSGRVHGQVLAIWATVLNKSVVGDRFVRYLLEHEAVLRKYGYPPLSPVVQGNAKDVPADIPHV